MTFSIVARDKTSGALGIATATAGPVVGALVPHGKANVGAIATQAMTNPYLALDCLDQLPLTTAREAMENALSRDEEADARQVIVVDAEGEIACWTGKACNPYAGHLAGDGVAVAGNMIAGAIVLDSMLDAYNAEAPFERRLLNALVAGEIAGGDIRGIGSAAIKIYRREAYPALDLRIDWAHKPLDDLSTLVDRTLTGDYAAFFDSVLKRNGEAA